MIFSPISRFYYTKRLFHALKKKDLKKSKKLLEKGASPNGKNKGWPYIFLTLETPPLLQLMIDFKADINAQNPNKHYTPLIFSIFHSLYPSAQILIQNHASLEPLSFAGLPALYYAVAAEDSRFLKLILPLETDKSFLVEIAEHAKQRNLNKKNIEFLENYIFSLNEKGLS